MLKEEEEERKKKTAPFCPETDQAALWPIFDKYKDGFVALRADCTVSPIKITVEQITHQS